MYSEHIAELLDEMASNDGEIGDYGLLDREDVIEAISLGLVEIKKRGQGWDMWDTITLSRQQRALMNLPPIPVRRSAAAQAFDSAAALLARLFGKKAL